jgi:hypothetical protein
MHAVARDSHKLVQSVQFWIDGNRSAEPLLKDLLETLAGLFKSILSMDRQLMASTSLNHLVGEQGEALFRFRSRANGRWGSR